ncbi:MAG: hypothetical protein NVS9B4_16520 [Candidatus Acidiferrum sp.]
MTYKNGRRIVMGGVLVLWAGIALAQEPIPMMPEPPLPPMMLQGQMGMEGGPEGAIGEVVRERIEVLGFGPMGGGKVVTGAPFSATAISESTQTLSDGNHIARKSEGNLYRDSQGRFRREVTLPAIGPLAATGKPKSFISIHDPVAGTNIVLEPEHKVARKIPLLGKGPGHGPEAGPSGETVISKRQVQELGKLNEDVVFRTMVGANENLKTEDLGTQTIEGVAAKGTRRTRTIPAGEIGNEAPIRIVSESWYSNDLQMVVRSKRSDPRFGESTYSLTNIQRQEPAASLFTVPADYTVAEDFKGRHGLNSMEGGPLPK